MSSPQEQDLVLFKDNNVITDKILNSSSSYLSVISNAEGTQPTWIVNTLIENAMVGTASQVNKDLNKRVPRRSDVIFISFSNPEDIYLKGCKKVGLELARDSNFQFIDCFTELFTKYITNPEDALTQVKSLFKSITDTIDKTNNSKRMIFLENPEILLYGTNISSIDLSHLITKLNRQCRNLFLITNQVSPQIVNLSNENMMDPSYKSTDFATKLHQKAHLNIHLEPLTTGRAKDITGILTVSKGAVPFDNGIVVDEKSFTYNVSKESNIKLYFR